MKTDKKISSLAKASTVLILFFILVSSTASASITETQISHSGSAGGPAIYGNNTVWLDWRNGQNHNDVYMYNFTTSQETQISHSGKTGGLPSIYGNKIVWSDYRNGGQNDPGVIYMYDTSTSQETQISYNGSAIQPIIYGNKIIWDENRDYPYFCDIFMHDLSTSQETQISHSGSAYNPAFYGGKIVWDQDTINKDDIYMYDLSTSQTTQISHSGRACLAEIYDNRIVWLDYRNGDDKPDIYMYDLSTSKETQISHSGSAGNCAIYGNRIVWQDNRNGQDNCDIFMYDLSTQKETQITTNDSQQDSPAIYGNNIVWTDNRNGKTDIYMGTVSTPDPGLIFPIANFTTNTTSGYAPLTVQFNDSSQNATGLNWSFGDGVKSSQQNTEHTYSTPGNYTVNLIASNENGTDSKVAKVTVLLKSLPPVPGITYAYIPNDVDGTVSVFNTATDTITDKIKVGVGPGGIAVNPDGKNIYIANSGDNTISVIDTATDNVTATVTGLQSPYGVAVNPDGTKLYVGNLVSPGTVYVIDTNIKVVVSTINGLNHPSGVAVNPTGTQVYVANGGSNTMSVIDTSTNKVIATVPVGNNPIEVAENPNGKLVYVTNYGSNTVSVIDTTTNKVTATVPVGVGPSGIAVNPDGSKVYVTNSDFPNSTISVIKTDTNTVVATILVGDNPVGVGVTLDGKKVYSTNHVSDTVSVIDSATNTVTATLKAGIHPHAFGKFICSIPKSEQLLPVANFTSNVTKGYAPLSVKFTDLSKNATGWRWSFGDGSTLKEQNVTHTFGAGNYTVNLTVSNTNGTDSKLATINVSKSIPIITWNNPADITYGTKLSSTQLNAVASVPGTYVYTPAAGTILSAGSQTLHVDFTPTDTANYTTASKDVTIKVTNVQKTTPQITWNNPADIAYGTKLSSTQLNAKASVSGTFVYTPPAGTVLKVGTQTLNTVFTPKDTTKYTMATQNVIINVMTVPLADFSASTTSGKAPLPVTFTDKSTGSPTAWTWQFGDGGSLTSKIPYAPVHTYTKKGTYTVKLTVSNVAGSSTKTMSIIVK